MPISLLTIAYVCTCGCHRKPKADFTQLKRDLLELRQHCDIRYETGLVSPYEFKHAADQLEIDYRLQQTPRPGPYSDKPLLDVIEQSKSLLSCAARHINSDPVNANWSSLVMFHTFLTSSIPVVVGDLELEESGALPSSPAP